MYPIYDVCDVQTQQIRRFNKQQLVKGYAQANDKL